MAPPETRYTKSGDVDIAYHVSGSGPFDLVWVQGYVNNVELHWEMPESQQLISRLSSFCRPFASTGAAPACRTELSA